MDEAGSRDPHAPQTPPREESVPEVAPRRARYSADEPHGRTAAQLDAEIAAFGDLPLYEPPSDGDDDYDWIFAGEHRDVGSWDDPSGPPTQPFTPPAENPPAEHPPAPVQVAAPVQAAAPGRGDRPANASSARTSRGRRGSQAALVTLATAVCLCLIATVAILGYGLSDRGEPIANPSEPVAALPIGEDWTGPVEAIDGVTAAAECVSPDARDDAGNPVPNRPSNLVDGEHSTAWRCAEDSRPRVTFTVPEGARIIQVGLINGYAKSEGGDDLYELYRRATLVRWTFADGTVVEQRLEDPNQDLQRLSILARAGGTVTLDIIQLSNSGEASVSRDDVVISEVVFYGPAD